MANGDPLALPTRIGDYEVLDRLAVGGMAEIFLGRSTKEAGFEKLVAIKRVKPHLALVPSFVEMFLDEARIAATLSHSNIVQIFDLGKADETYYIAMEYVPGVSLNELQGHLGRAGCRASGSLSALIMMSVCIALEYAHTKRDLEGRPLNIIHRDVSPSNVVVSFEGDIKLIDFGIVKATVRLHQTQGGEIKGKRGYISPEQLVGRSADARSDIFAAGMVLHGLLCQRRPQVDSAEGWPPPPPSQLVEAVPPELEAICMKAIEVDPARRYQTALEMGTELEAYWQRAPFTRLQLAAWMKETFRPAYEQQRRAAGLALEPSLSVPSYPPPTVPIGPPAAAVTEETALLDGAEGAPTAILSGSRMLLTEIKDTIPDPAPPRPRARARIPVRALGLAALLLALPLGVLLFTWIGTPPTLRFEADQGLRGARAPSEPRAVLATRDAGRLAQDLAATAAAPPDASASAERAILAPVKHEKRPSSRKPVDRKPVDRRPVPAGGKPDVPKKAPKLPYDSL